MCRTIALSHLFLLVEYSNSTADQAVSLSMFAYLFSEMVQYHQNRVDSISECKLVVCYCFISNKYILISKCHTNTTHPISCSSRCFALLVERRLEATGYGVGLRVLELLAFRSREYKRETKLMNVLQFVSTVAWKALFGKAADSLERSSTYMNTESRRIVTRNLPLCGKCSPTFFAWLFTILLLSLIFLLVHSTVDHEDEFMVIDYSPITRYVLLSELVQQVRTVHQWCD